MHREPLRHQKRTQWNERDDQDRKTDSSDSLGDCDCARDTENLEADIRPDLPAWNSIKRILRIEETLFRVQIPEFGKDAVTFDRAPL